MWAVSPNKNETVCLKKKEKENMYGGENSKQREQQCFGDKSREARLSWSCRGEDSE